MNTTKSSTKITNIALSGSTGNGKSSTACEIIGIPNAFKIGSSFKSCTIDIKSVLKNGFLVIDLPGYGDLGLKEDQIINTIKGIANEVRLKTIEPKFLDAFVMVQKATPRLSTLKRDIESQAEIFGYGSLKSTVILVIEENPKPYEEFLEMTTSLKEINNIFAEADSSLKPTFIRWSNKVPYGDQNKQLDEFFKKSPQYTHKIFEDAQNEMIKRNERLFADRLKKESQKIKMKHQGDLRKVEEALEEKERELKKNLAKENEERLAAVKEARKIQQKMEELQNEVNEKERESIEEYQRLKEQIEFDVGQQKERELMEKLEEKEKELKKISEKKPIIATIILDIFTFGAHRLFK